MRKHVVGGVMCSVGKLLKQTNENVIMKAELIAAVRNVECARDESW